MIVQPSEIDLAQMNQGGQQVGAQGGVGGALAGSSAARPFPLAGAQRLPGQVRDVGDDAVDAPPASSTIRSGSSTVQVFTFTPRACARSIRSALTNGSHGWSAP